MMTDTDAIDLHASLMLAPHFMDEHAAWIEVALIFVRRTASEFLLDEGIDVLDGRVAEMLDREVAKVRGQIADRLGAKREAVTTVKH